MKSRFHYRLFQDRLDSVKPLRCSLQHRPIWMKQKQILHIEISLALREECQPTNIRARTRSDGNLEQARSERRRYGTRSVAVRCVATTATGAEEACRRFMRRVYESGTRSCADAPANRPYTGRHIYRCVGARARPPPRSPREAAMQARASLWPAREWLTTCRRVSHTSAKCTQLRHACACEYKR